MTTRSGSGSVRGASVASASLIIMSAFLASRVLGLLRTAAMAAAFGNGQQADAFQAAFAVPDIVFNLVVGGALNSAFIPVFSELMTGGDARRAWRLASTVLNAVTVALVVLSVLAALLAPLLTHLIAPGFDPARQTLLVQLMRILFLQPIFFGIGAAAFAILNARQHFLMPAWAPVVYNAFQILSLWILVPKIGVNGLAIGVVFGAAAYAVMQFPTLRRLGFSYSRVIEWQSADAQRVTALLLPRTATLAATQLGHTFTTRTLASAFRGAVAALGYAYTLLLLPIGILGVSIATAAFPTLSQQAAAGDWQTFRSSLRRPLLFLIYTGIGSTAMLIVLRGSIVATLLNHGAFSQSDVAVTSGLLLVYAIGLTAHLLDELMPRAFFALQDTLTPLWTTLVVVLINVVVSIFAVTRWGVAGIPLGLTVAAIVEAVVLVYLLERRLKGLMSPTALRHIHRCLNAGLAAIGAGTLAVATFGLDITGPFVANLAHLIIGGIFVGAVYVGLAWLYGVDEHEQIIERFGRSLRRAPKAP